jgi:hypothetical protein
MAVAVVLTTQVEVEVDIAFPHLTHLPLQELKLFLEL